MPVPIPLGRSLCRGEIQFFLRQKSARKEQSQTSRPCSVIRASNCFSSPELSHRPDILDWQEWRLDYPAIQTLSFCNSSKLAVSHGHGSRSNNIIVIRLEGRQRIWLWMCHTHLSPPTLSSFVVSCAFLVLSTKSLLVRHDGRGVSKKSAVFFCGTKTAVFVPPFEKDLLTRFHSEMSQYILQYMKNVLSYLHFHLCLVDIFKKGVQK